MNCSHTGRDFKKGRTPGSPPAAGLPRTSTLLNSAWLRDPPQGSGSRHRDLSAHSRKKICNLVGWGGPSHTGSGHKIMSRMGTDAGCCRELSGAGGGEEVREPRLQEGGCRPPSWHPTNPADKGVADTQALRGARLQAVKEQPRGNPPEAHTWSPSRGQSFQGAPGIRALVRVGGCPSLVMSCTEGGSARHEQSLRSVRGQRKDLLRLHPQKTLVK